MTERSPYTRAWFTYFRADAESDAAREACIKALQDNGWEDNPLTEKLKRAYYTAYRKARAAEDYADELSEGIYDAEAEAAVEELTREAQEAKKEAQKEIARRARKAAP